MLREEHVKRFANMPDSLRKALEQSGIDPAFVIVMKRPTTEEAENDEIVVHVLIAPDHELVKTDLRKREATGDEILSPEGKEVMYMVRPDATASVCRKVGQTWLWV